MFFSTTILIGRLYSAVEDLFYATTDLYGGVKEERGRGGGGVAFENLVERTRIINLIEALPRGESKAPNTWESASETELCTSI